MKLPKVPGSFYWTLAAAVAGGLLVNIASPVVMNFMGGRDE